ncbi:hypothetical protein ACHQM5_029149 [Ranunculus cassubicifolius]
MSPSKFYSNEQQVKKEINPTRPSPLQINQKSHLIQKSSSSSSNSSSNSNSNSISNAKNNRPPTHQQRHPVIIYTHSPKVIHTKARDFMALVQKLTGMSRSEDNEGAMQRQDGKKKVVGQDDTTSSSVVTDENCGGGGGGVTDFQVNSSSISPGFDQVPNPYLSDVPLFAQNSSDFCCSSRPLYRYPDHIFSSPNMGNTISGYPDVLKGYPDYCN